jgi:hypothetical protein
MKQRGITGIIMGSVMILIYIVLHLNTAWYKDTRILIFGLAPVGEVRNDFGFYTAITLQSVILTTPYGNIEMPVFTEIGCQNGRGNSLIRYILTSKRLKHTIVILGNQITNLRCFFFHDKGEEIDWDNNQDTFGGAQGNQEAILGKYTLGIEKIKTMKKDNYEELEFILTEFPDILYLSDGTEIHTVNRWGIKPPMSLKIINNDTWIFQKEEGGHTFPIKKPTDTDYTYYEDISFKENWGDFIGGIIEDE